MACKHVPVQAFVQSTDSMYLGVIDVYLCGLIKALVDKSATFTNRKACDNQESQSCLKLI